MLLTGKFPSVHRSCCCQLPGRKRTSTSRPRQTNRDRKFAVRISATAKPSDAVNASTNGAGKYDQKKASAQAGSRSSQLEATISTNQSNGVKSNGTQPQAQANTQKPKQQAVNKQTNTSTITQEETPAPAPIPALQQTSASDSAARTSSRSPNGNDKADIVQKPVAVPDKRSAESITMPSTAAAQAAADTSTRDSPAVITQDHSIFSGAKPSFIIPELPGFPPSRQVDHLPLMLYVPGIDGTGMAASRQFPGLMECFDFRAFSVPVADRTPFQGLVDILKEYLEQEVDVDKPERPVYLLGESFGAVLALAVAHDKPDLVDRLVLVNPATSYEKSIWPQVGPLLAEVPDAVYNAVPYLLSPILGNPLALAAVNVDRKASLATQASQYADGLRKLIPQLGYLTKILPPASLQWKLELLKQGNAVVQRQLPFVQQRVFLMTADGDLLIPSKEEGPRLKKLLPRCRHKVFKDASHALLQEANVNLAQLMRDEGFYVEQRKMSAPIKKRSKASFGSAFPIELPTKKELDIFAEGATKTLTQLQSPIFLSTMTDGSVHQGCGGIPLDRPLLLVSNHQTFALDIGLLIEGLLRQTGVLPRGLTHPAVFQGNLQERKDSPDPQSNVFGSLLTTFGSVEVGGRNFYKLMKQGECVLLYPGGVREAYKGRGEEYKLFWPKHPEFVRMAARFGATIVPFGGVGLDDGFEMLLSPQEIRGIPVLGKWLEENAKKKIPPARRGTSLSADVEELFIQPLPLPKLPQRLYFKFQQPIRTKPEDVKDPARVQQIYEETQRSCESAIDYLLVNRKRDPYKDFLPRMLYERSWNGKQAPTFPLK